MAITLVRKNSETPNIRNIDDTRMVRYSTYGKSGIIKNYGEEIELTQATANTLHIGTGEIVHQGWQVEINGAGLDITLDNRDTVEYYTIYLEINLAVSTNQTASILLQKANNAYPTINPGDDLTQVPTGTSRLEIAHIYLVPGQSIFNITPLLEIIEYDDIRKVNKNEIYGSGQAHIINHGDYVQIQVEDVNNSVQIVISQNTGDHNFDIQVEQNYNGQSIQYDLIATLTAITNKHLYRHIINWDKQFDGKTIRLTFVLYLSIDTQLTASSVLNYLPYDAKFPCGGYYYDPDYRYDLLFQYLVKRDNTGIYVYINEPNGQLAYLFLRPSDTIRDTVTMVY